MHHSPLLIFVLIICHTTLTAQYAPELDVRGTDDTNDGAEFQLATPSEANFLRFYSGRIGDPSPYLYFSSQDTFRIASGSSNFFNFNHLLSIDPLGKFQIHDLMGIGERTVMVDSNGTLKASPSGSTFFSASLAKDSILQNSIFYTVINWNENKDGANNFDPDSGIYTVPEGGIYSFNLQCGWRRDASDLDDVPITMRFIVNGGTLGPGQKIERVVIRSNYGEDTSHSLITNLFKGDEISISVSAVTGGPTIRLNNTSTFLSGIRIN